MNGIGIGPQTHDSPPVHTVGRQGPHADETLHLGGHGHGSAVEENRHGVLGPVVTIDDAAEAVSRPTIATLARCRPSGGGGNG